MLSLRKVAWWFGGGAKRALSLLKGAHYGFSVVRYGEGSDADDFECYGKGIRYSEEGCFFDVNFRGRELLNLFIPLWGRFAVQNVLAAVAVLLEIGLSEVEIREGLATYPGVRRRLEVCATWGAGVIVVDDFGHHPTAIKETLQAARQRWPNRRLWALYEPRSATARRNVLERELQNALLGADCVVIASHERLMEIPEAERFSPVGMAEALCLAGLDAWSIDEPALIVKHLQRHAEREDVVVMFSNGSFGGLRELLSKT